MQPQIKPKQPKTLEEISNILSKAHIVHSKVVNQDGICFAVDIEDYTSFIDAKAKFYSNMFFDFKVTAFKNSCTIKIEYEKRETAYRPSAITHLN